MTYHSKWLYVRPMVFLNSVMDVKWESIICWKIIYTTVNCTIPNGAITINRNDPILEHGKYIPMKLKILAKDIFEKGYRDND